VRVEWTRLGTCLGYYTGKGLARKWPEPLGRRVKECSETSEYKIQTPGTYPKESIQHSVHRESLKSRNKYCIVWVCVFSLRYPACNAHAPYCHSYPARLYDIFSHYLINGTIFEKKIIEHKMRAFAVQRLSETFLILSRIKRYDQKCILVFM